MWQMLLQRAPPSKGVGAPEPRGSRLGRAACCVLPALHACAFYVVLDYLVIGNGCLMAMMVHTVWCMVGVFNASGVSHSMA